jgi:hypothetical protein
VGSQRQYWYAIVFIMLLIAGLGWLGAALDFTTGATITVILVAVAVSAVIGIFVIGGAEGRSRRSDRDRGL